MLAKCFPFAIQLILNCYLMLTLVNFLLLNCYLIAIFYQSGVKRIKKDRHAGESILSRAKGMPL